MLQIDIKAAVSKYIEGYSEGRGSSGEGGRLTKAEADFVPDGIVLRILSNVIFFAGRSTTTPPQGMDRAATAVVVVYVCVCVR